MNIKNTLFGTDKPRSLVLGFGLAVIVVFIAIYIDKYIGIFLNLEKSPVSIIMLAIILGIIIKNTIGIPNICDPGINFCLTKILRLGIILLGASLSIFAVIKVGVIAVGIVAVCIVSGLIIIYFVAKWLKLDERLGTLIAVGTGICGATAIVATGSIIKAKKEDIAYAVATITIFGIIAMFTYPYVTHFIGLNDIQAGIVMGVGVHETAQVVGAGLIYDQLWEKEGEISGGDTAIITKLVRNTFLVIVIPFIAFLYLRRYMQDKVNKEKISPLDLFPMFILGFILFAVFRSIGDYAIVNNGMFIDPAVWNAFLAQVNYFAKLFLAIAMAGVGLGTNIKELKSIGLKPFFAGLFGATTIGAIALLIVIVLAQFLVV